MNYSFEKSFEILHRTPVVLESMLSGLSDEWILPNEGEKTFSAFDVVGHLLHGEKTDWMVRAKNILENGTAHPFEPYDRFAMFEESKGKNINQLMNEFKTERMKNIALLESFSIDENKLNLKGIHPKFGEVTLRQLLSTWVIHDLTHIAQIARVLAKQYKDEMGPWLEYFNLMQD